MSDNEHITVRIVDIARMAGVSVATVDRVIHNRRQGLGGEPRAHQ